MPIIHCPQGNPETNTHYRNLSEINKQIFIPETHEMITEIQTDYKTRYGIDGKPIFNRDRLSCKSC